ncbi:T9SS type A sorting domain-containing protein [bacterium]|nr:T9SS type A sorting domain-containing protein [bacterium]
MTIRAWGVLLSVLLLTTAGIAQITLTMDDFAIHPYTELTREIGPNDNQMTAGGPDQTWDFSASPTPVTWTEAWDDPAGHAGAGEFPSANNVWIGPLIQDQQQFRYFHTTATTNHVVGAAYDLGGGNVIAVATESEGFLVTCPVYYLDAWDYVSTSIYNDETTVDSSHYSIDAWGTLTDVNGTYDVLRMRRNNTTTTYPSGEISVNVSYTWFAPDWGEIVTIKSGSPNDPDPLFNNGTFERISSVTTGVHEQDPQLARSFELLPAYPNPFNAATTLNLSLPTPGTVHVAVFNTLGQQVATVADGVYTPGTHRLSFDAAGLSSGIYLVRASTPNHVATQRITVLK